MSERQQRSQSPGPIDRFVRAVGRIFSANDETGERTVEEQSEQCCEGKVNIAYRGVSDERLYMAYGRKWPEVRYFKPHGLRVFCADCRRRLL